MKVCSLVLFCFSLAVVLGSVFSVPVPAPVPHGGVALVPVVVYPSYGHHHHHHHGGYHGWHGGHGHHHHHHHHGGYGHGGYYR